jgi:Thioredoxin domain-containing protein
MTELPELGPGPVVVRAWAPWCSNCRAMHPIVEQVAATRGVRVVDVQVDESPGLTQELAIRSVPTLVALRGGVEAGRLVGARPRDAIESLFETAQGTTTGVRATTPMVLLAGRTIVGLALAIAGAVLGAITLVGAGAAIGTWGLAGVVRRATTARS